MEKFYYLYTKIAVETPSPSDLGLPKVAGDEGSVKSLLNIVFGAAAAVAVLMIVVMAFILVTAEGQPEKISRVKKAIIYTLVGLTIVLSADLIIQMILSNV